MRIQHRLSEIDGDQTTAFLRQTDDWWFKQKGDVLLKDADSEKYKSVKLASRWSLWINAFVKERTTAMQYLLVELFYVLETDWEDAKTYAELAEPARKDFKANFELRMKKLRAHVKETVNFQMYAIVTVSRP